MGSYWRQLGGGTSLSGLGWMENEEAGSAFLLYTWREAGGGAEGEGQADCIECESDMGPNPMTLRP